MIRVHDDAVSLEERAASVPAVHPRRTLVDAVERIAVAPRAKSVRAVTRRRSGSPQVSGRPTPARAATQYTREPAARSLRVLCSGVAEETTQHTASSDIPVTADSQRESTAVATLAPAPADTPLTDQRGFPRIVDGNGDGIATIDVGAFEVEEGVVRISGTAANDEIVVTHTTDGLNLHVTLNGVVISDTISLVHVSEIRVWGRVGDDDVAMVDLAQALLLNGGLGSDRLTGGRGCAPASSKRGGRRVRSFFLLRSDPDEQHLRLRQPVLVPSAQSGRNGPHLLDRYSDHVRHRLCCPARLPVSEAISS